MANYRDLIQAINQEHSNIAALDARIRTGISTSAKLNELINTVQAMYTDKDQRRVVTQRVVRRVNAACPLYLVTYNRTTKAYEFISKETVKAAKAAAKAVTDAAKETPDTAEETQKVIAETQVVVATVGMVRASALAEALATIEDLIKALEVAEMAAVVTTAATAKKASLKKAA